MFRQRVFIEFGIGIYTKSSMFVAYRSVIPSNLHNAQIGFLFSFSKKKRLTGQDVCMRHKTLTPFQVTFLIFLNAIQGTLFCHCAVYL